MTESTTNRKEMVTRDAILMMLSDDEVASVSTSETKRSLKEHTEYVDLDELALGIQKATATTVSLGNLLPESAVHEKTWKRIKAALAGCAVPSAPAPGKK